MLRIGIIGSGFGKTGLLPAFTSIPRSKVIGLCGSKEEWPSFLEREDLDAIALSVPPRAQYTIAKAAIQKGLHVFAEKPLAANLLQARELLALAKKKRVVHGIDFMFPEIAEWKKVQELLDAKTFGRLQHVSENWTWQSGDIRYGRKTWRTRVREGGGALSFYFSHGLYYLERFAGKIHDVSATFAHSKKSAGGGEVGFDMRLKFKSGATGAVHVSCNAPELVRHRLVFECERGAITLENKNAVVDGFTVKTSDASGDRIVKVKKDAGRRGEDERVKAVRKLAKRFVDACLNNRQTSPSFRDGVRVQELIENIRRSGGRRAL